MNWGFVAVMLGLAAVLALDADDFFDWLGFMVIMTVVTLFAAAVGSVIV